jgi:hypothetical protein
MVERDFWQNILERWVVVSPMLAVSLLGFVVSLVFIGRARGAALCAAAGFAMNGTLSLIDPIASSVLRNSFHTPVAWDAYFFVVSALHALALVPILAAVFIGRKPATT